MKGFRHFILSIEVFIIKYIKLVLRLKSYFILNYKGNIYLFTKENNGYIAAYGYGHTPIIVYDFTKEFFYFFLKFREN